MNIKYNQEIEVSETKYNLCVKSFPMIIAHRKTNNKFFIKLWDMRYKEALKKVLSL